MSRCREKKTVLSGAVQQYDCELLHHSYGFGMLRYVVDREYDVAGVQLAAGDVTHALYWSNRPYTLYTWHLQRIGVTLYYFNIADTIVLTPDEFRWRDLTVDILVDSRNTVRVLDEDELPAELPPELHRYIRSAKLHLLNHYHEIIKEAEAYLKGYAAT